MQKEKCGSDFSRQYVKELWSIFEKTGSIGAFLLYNETRKKPEKPRSVREKK